MVCDTTRSDSQDTTSASVLEDSINISFKDIHYTVRDGFFTRGRKSLLNGLSGSFNAGELSVIIGQSGAGKSTLMDILAGYTKPASGSIFINDQLRDDKWFRRRSCYIMQNDQLQEMLTTEESLKVAADLKLGEHVSKEQKNKRVKEIIAALGLQGSINRRTIHLSGGEKKRLAIGLELVSDPPVMFLDEPTSGLDSSMSKQIIYLLQMLARQGRTIVVTLHQPSAPLLKMIDRLYAVVRGRCAYIGSESQLDSFLDSLNLKCPSFHNKVDFFIEVLPDNSDRLVRAAENGLSKNWITSIEADKWMDFDVLEPNYNVDIFQDISLTALPPPKEDETRKILLKIKSTYSTSSWTQFCTLTRRQLLILWRNPTFTQTILGVHGSIALFIGILFYNIGEDAKYMQNNYNFLYFSLMFIMFTAFSTVSINFPRELPVVRREHFNRWYTTGAYFTATVASNMPIQTTCSIAYALVTYWMTGQPQHALRFFGFSWMLLHISYVALCLGLLNGSLFSTKHAVVFGPFFVMPFTIFSGFFLRYKDAPFFSRWIFHISFLKHGLAGLMVSIFGMDRNKLPCSDLYCHYAYPKQFLSDNGSIEDSYGLAVVILFGINGIIVLGTYIVLKIRLKRKW